MSNKLRSARGPDTLAGAFHNSRAQRARVPDPDVESVQISELPEEVAGCAACLEAGDPWCHLRICLTCGNIGCCDSSPNRHASRHALQESHPIVRSAEPGEEWSYCFVDDVAFVLRAE